jgi:hypothetical protein
MKDTQGAFRDGAGIAEGALHALRTSVPSRDACRSVMVAEGTIMNRWQAHRYGPLLHPHRALGHTLCGNVAIGRLVTSCH